MTEVTYGSELGRGVSKTVFNVIYKPRDVRNNYTFTTDKDPSNLVMVMVNIDLSSGETVLNNKEFENLITELTYQYNLSINDPKLAPFIYKIKVIRKRHTFFSGIQKYSSNEINISDFLTNPNTYLDSNITREPSSENDEIKVVVLEEKCGIPIANNNSVVVNEHFIEMVINLINIITQKTNSFLKDFKLANTCPVYDSSGNLINLILLDLDPTYITTFDDISYTFNQNTNVEISNITIQNICQGIMIVQFFVFMLKYTRRLTSEEKTLIKTALQRMPQEDLKRMISFLQYISPYTQTNNSLSYIDISKKFPIIYYTLTSTGRYNNSQLYLYEGYVMLLKELYVDLSQIIYDDNSITEADVEFYPANEFSTSQAVAVAAEPVVAEAEPQQPSVENNNIYLKIQIVNDLLDKYLESLSCNVVKVLQQEGEQNPFISNTIQSQIRKGIMENNKKVYLNENNITELIKILVNYLYTNKISYIDQDRRCNYYINTNIITSEELEILGYYITTLTNTTASGGKVNKRKKLTKRKVKKRKLTKRKYKVNI